MIINVLSLIYYSKLSDSTYIQTRKGTFQKIQAEHYAFQRQSIFLRNIQRQPQNKMFSEYTVNTQCSPK